MQTLSPAATRTMSLGSLRRTVRSLRDECSAFELETDRLKRAAEMAATPADAPRARLAVEQDRSAQFADLRAKLRNAEAKIAAWRPAARKAVEPTSFGAMFSKTIRAKVSA